MKPTLLIVDVQNAMIEANPVNKIRFLEVESLLLEEARKAAVPVIFIQHNGPPGSPLQAGRESWKIYKLLKPLNSEIVLEKKYNSSFKQTDLNRILTDLKVDTIVLTGMQTEFCIDTTCRIAFEKGYKVIIPEDSNTTFSTDLLDGEIIVLHHNRFIFDGRFAKIMNPHDVIELIFRNREESEQ